MENDWVGAETGLLDQLASLRGSEGHALRIDFATLSLDPVPLDLGDWRLVTVESGAGTRTPARATTRAGRSAARRARAMGIEHLSEADAGCGRRAARCR